MDECPLYVQRKLVNKALVSNSHDVSVSLITIRTDENEFIKMPNSSDAMASKMA